MNKPKGNATATSPAATRKPRCRTGKETFVNTPTPKNLPRKIHAAEHAVGAVAGVIQNDIVFETNQADFGYNAGFLGSDSNFHAKHPAGTPEGWWKLKSDPNKPGHTSKAPPYLTLNPQYKLTEHIVQGASFNFLEFEGVESKAGLNFFAVGLTRLNCGATA
jgi:hypothetical protein